MVGFGFFVVLVNFFVAFVVTVLVGLVVITLAVVSGGCCVVVVFSVVYLPNMKSFNDGFSQWG